MSVLRVVEPFSCDVDGVPRVYRAGDLVHSSDKVTKGRAKFFTEVEEFADRAAARSSVSLKVEQATAAPGELRARTAPEKPAKKSATKKAQKKA